MPPERIESIIARLVEALDYWESKGIAARSTSPQAM